MTKRICFFISTLSCGGAEKVAVDLAAAWRSQGNAVTFITLSNPESDHFHLAPGIQRRALDLMGESRNGWEALRFNWRRVRALRKTLKEVAPDVIISFMDKNNILALFAAKPLSIPVVATEHIHMGEHPLPRFWESLRKITYPWASAVTWPSQNAKTYFDRNYPGLKTCVIPNPIDGRFFHQNGFKSLEPAADQKGGIIVGMGRLTHQKGFDLLIEVFDQIKASAPGWQLQIYGEGPERPFLEKVIAQKNLGGVVSLMGKTDTPHQVFSQADIVVVPSRFEGFSLVLAEAMASRCPCVVFDCPSGPSEISVDGQFAELIPLGDTQAMARAIISLIRDPVRRRDLGALASQSIQNRFHIGAVLAQWEVLLDRIALP